MTWHIAAPALQAYAHGGLDGARAYSVEEHLITCGDCRSAIARHIDRARLDALWDTVADQTALPAPGIVERTMLRLGVTDHIARLLAATPSLRLSWLLAVGFALFFAVVAAHGSINGFVLFLVVAPLLPLAGVAAAYGPGVDPTYEIGLAAPLRSFHLLLIRTVAVLTTTMGLAALAALAMPQLDWKVAAWLLPSLGLTAAGLALATRFHPLRAAIGVGVAWIALAGFAAWGASTSAAFTAEDVFGGMIQAAFLGILVVSSFVLFARRDEFERRTPR